MRISDVRSDVCSSDLDIGTNESMAEGGAPTQGLLIAGGPIDLGACGCKVIVSSLTYNEDNGTPVGGDYGDELDILADQQQGGDYGDDCNDCADDQQPIFGAGFVAKVNDIDGSESLTRIAIATTTEPGPLGGEDSEGLEVALPDGEDLAATNV